MTHQVDVYWNLKFVETLPVAQAEDKYLQNSIGYFIEEYGRCDTCHGEGGRDTITFVSHGDPVPDAYHVGE